MTSTLDLPTDSKLETIATATRFVCHIEGAWAEITRKEALLLLTERPDIVLTVLSNIDARVTRDGLETPHVAGAVTIAIQLS